MPATVITTVAATLQITRSKHHCPILEIVVLAFFEQSLKQGNIDLLKHSRGQLRVDEEFRVNQMSQ
jgi:hypothetical protein